MDQIERQEGWRERLEDDERKGREECGGQRDESKEM